MNLPFFIAKRYLVKQKGAFSSFIIRLAIIATALSVATMIIAMAIMTGFSDSVSGKLFGFMGHVHVVPYDETRSSSLTFSEPIYLDRNLVAGIKKIPHVVSVAPFLEKPALVQSKGQMEGFVLKGVNKEYSFMEGISLEGNWISFADSSYAKQVLLSQSMANRLNVNIGDTVQLDFFEAGMPRIRKVRVCGLYHSGMEEVDKMFGVCDMRLLQRINNWGADSVNGFQVNLDNPAYADTVSNYIHYNLTRPPLESYTLTQIYDFIYDWLRMQSVNSVILSVIMAIVAIINMGAILLILMVDRAKMIGLLKALGMPFDGTRNVFLYIAGLIAGSGIFAGNLFAFLLCWLQVRFGLLKLPEQQYYMSTVPVKIVWWHVAVIDVTTLVLCIFCMWLPTLYIRRIQPARVLQFR